MPVSQEYLEYVVDQLACVGEINPKRMFGVVGLYYDGLFFAVIASDVLYFKVDDENRPMFHAAGVRPFQVDDRESHSMSYYEVPVDVLENTDDLRTWALGAIAAAGRKASSRKRKKKKL